MSSALIFPLSPLLSIFHSEVFSSVGSPDISCTILCRGIISSVRSSPCSWCCPDFVSRCHMQQPSFTWHKMFKVCNTGGQLNPINWFSSTEKCILRCKSSRYLNITNTIVFTTLSFTIQGEFNLSIIILNLVSLSGYVLYSSPHTFCWQNVAA